MAEEGDGSSEAVAGAASTAAGGGGAKAAVPDETVPVTVGQPAVIVGLKARPEQSIAVVAHWVFLKHMFTAHAADPALATNFKNAELRTAALFSGSGKVEL